ncbi:hypothetical protein KAU33_02890, partial [Candidatus Dependentiae bacterium]|nr:hypothetical protein [Candidatus Dependentiae bacterium]
MKDYKRWVLKDSELEELTTVKVRDLIEQCFYDAQKEIYIISKKRLNVPFDDDKVRQSIKATIRLAINHVNGDVDNPSKETLYEVLNILEQKASVMYSNYL